MSEERTDDCDICRSSPATTQIAREDGILHTCPGCTETMVTSEGFKEV